MAANLVIPKALINNGVDVMFALAYLRGLRYLRNERSLMQPLISTNHPVYNDPLLNLFVSLGPVNLDANPKRQDLATEELTRLLVCRLSHARAVWLALAAD